MPILIAEREVREGRKLPYRTIAAESGVSEGVIVRFSRLNLERFDSRTLDALCRCFDCSVGEVIERIGAPRYGSVHAEAAARMKEREGISRISALGKFAGLHLSSDDVRKERNEEIKRDEERFLPRQKR